MRYNDVDPRSLHAGISIAKEIPPGSPTSQLETLSGSTGEIIAGRTIQQGEYTVRVNIAGKYAAQAWEIRRRLAEWACAADSVTHPLVPTHWPSVCYDAILKDISPPEFTFGFAKIDVKFTLPRPFARDLAQHVSSYASTQATVTIGGTSYTRPELTIVTGEGYGLEVAVDDTVLFGMSRYFYEGDVVEITAEPPTVTVTPISTGEKVQAESYVDYTVTDFEALCKALTPGSHTITCERAASIRAVWRNEWL